MGTQVKRIKLEKLLDIRGGKFELPKRDIRGRAKPKTGKDSQQCPTCSRPAEFEMFETDDLRDVLEEILLYRIPREEWTGKGMDVKVAEAYRELAKSRATKDGVLEMSADSFAFVSDLLDSESTIQQFLVNTVPIREALQNFHYAREGKEKPE